MVPDRKAINRMRELGKVQELRVHAAAGQLTTAQLQSRTERTVWQDASGREADVRGKFERMLQSGGFACGTYTASLDLLNAHSFETLTRLEVLQEAEAREAAVSAAYRAAEAQAGLVQQDLARMTRRWQRKTADQQELEGRDLHTIRLGEDVR